MKETNTLATIHRTTLELRSLQSHLEDEIKKLDITKEVSTDDYYTRQKVTQLTGKVATEVDNFEHRLAELDQKSESLNKLVREYIEEHRGVRSEREEAILSEAESHLRISPTFIQYVERCISALKFVREDLTTYDLVNPHKLKEDLKHDWTFYRYQVKRLRRI